jgi:hypothetical protein
MRSHTATGCAFDSDLGERCRRAARWGAAGLGVGVGAYAALAAKAWHGYGHPPRPAAADADPMLDAVMPIYDVVERHRLRVDAPAAITLAAAREMDVMHSPLPRAIFALRGLVLGAAPDAGPRPRGLLEDVLALGWRVVAEAPGREIVVAAVTRPWEPNPTFIGLDSEAFTACAIPEAVKIAWTLRVDPIDDDHAIFRTETRAVGTDAAGRARFRPYWALAAPGIWAIRRLSLAPLAADAERRARDTRDTRNARVTTAGAQVI